MGPSTKLLINVIISLRFYILKWTKYTLIYNMVVIKFVLVLLFTKVMWNHLLKEKNLKIFIILLLQNYHMKNFGKLFIIMLIKNMILINLKLYLFLGMVRLELKISLIVSQMHNLF